MQILKPLEYPEWEIDLDAMRVENLAFEFVRQSFANQQLVDFGAPARSRRVMRYRSCFMPRMSMKLSRLFLKSLRLFPVIR